MYEIIEELSGGIINDTFLAMEKGQKIVVQKINTGVFHKPKEVMENMVRVTSFIREKLLLEGRDPDRETLTFLQEADGSYLSYRDGGVYRKSVYISDTFTLLKPADPDKMREAGRLYGDFQRLLSDFQADSLYETIPDFHNTKKRYESFLAAVKEDAAGRVREVSAEIDELISLSFLSTCLEDCGLPRRVAHNDTKIANLLFDAHTKKALAVIDLETVMPGLSLHDFGDAIRSGANSRAEDDPDIDGAGLVPELYEAFKEGFLAGTKGTLTDMEIERLDYGAAVIIYEQTLRFLTDYLKGDVYYKISYPTHNLIRARNQLKLLLSFLDYKGGRDYFLG